MPNLMRTTRYTALQGAFAAAILLALSTLIVLGVTRHLSGLPTPASQSVEGVAQPKDFELYVAVAERIAKGEGYYGAIVTEHRARHYPLHPFVTVRPPALAEITGHVGLAAMPFLLVATAFAAWLSFAMRLRHRVSAIAWFAGTLALAAGLVVFIAPNLAFFHESWAAVLIVLSLSWRSRDHWVASVLVGLAACAVRELAFPYLCVMFVAAFIDGSRRELVGWSLAIGAFGVLLAAHAVILASYVTPDDLASPSWVAIGGWAFVLTTFRFSPLLCEAPGWIVALVVPVSLLGWIAWRDAIGLRGALLLCGFALAFTVLGRANNVYWGLMVAPLLLVGLVFAPGALFDLLKSLRSPHGPWTRMGALPTEG